MVITEEIPRFQNRKNPRLKNYDYKQPNHYFITICTNQKRCLFGSPDKLSVFGEIAYQAFSEIPNHFPFAIVDKFVVMPNHIHAILVITEYGTDLSLVVGHYKAYVTKRIRMFSPKAVVWQASFHDHVIRNETDYRRIWEYVDTNPSKWLEDCFYSPEA